MSKVNLAKKKADQRKKKRETDKKKKTALTLEQQRLQQEEKRKRDERNAQKRETARRRRVTSKLIHDSVSNLKTELQEFLQENLTLLEDKFKCYVDDKVTVNANQSAQPSRFSQEKKEEITQCRDACREDCWVCRGACCTCSTSCCTCFTSCCTCACSCDGSDDPGCSYCTCDGSNSGCSKACVANSHACHRALFRRLCTRIHGVRLFDQFAARHRTLIDTVTHRNLLATHRGG